MAAGCKVPLSLLLRPSALFTRVVGKKGLAEVAAVRRVHFIYERAARKFKGDLDLWMRWITFCKASKSGKQLSKVSRTQATHQVPILASSSLHTR